MTLKAELYFNAYETRTAQGSMSFTAPADMEPNTWQLGHAILKALGFRDSASIDVKITLKKAFGDGSGRWYQVTYQALDHVSRSGNPEILLEETEVLVTPAA